MLRFNSKVKEYFQVIGGAMIIIGAVAGLIVAVVFGKSASGYYYTYYERNWGLTIGFFFLTFLPCAFSGMLMIAISEALTALERICNNITCLASEDSSVTGYSTGVDGCFNSAEAISKLSAVASGETYSGISGGDWICPACGKRNKSFDDICSCGEPRN